MGKIFCLIGKSNTGKDTIYKILKEDRELGLMPVIPYTTRPKRKNELNGVQYYFIDHSEMEAYDKMGVVIEQRSYTTVNGIWHYCTIDDGQIDLTKGNYLLIATLESFKKLQGYFGVKKVIPFYITVEDGLRLERALQRESEQPNPDYSELCRRFLGDNIDFTRDKLDACSIKNYYYNHDLKECVGNIKSDMLKLI